MSFGISNKLKKLFGKTEEVQFGSEKSYTPPGAESWKSARDKDNAMFGGEFKAPDVTFDQPKTTSDSKPVKPAGSSWTDRLKGTGTNAGN